jgi:hypothetical protein
MEIDKDKAIVKWMPIIDNVFGYKNTYLNNTICIFCEKYSLRVKDQTHLHQKLNELKNKLDNTNRIPVTKSFYNPLTGIIEHELESGVSVLENKEGFNIKNFDEQTFIDLFGKIGVEILRETDPEKFRNDRLKSILDEKEFKNK